MEDCDFAQQWPRLWGADSSPSTLMALPSCTVTQTPHSTLPQARQHVRTCFSSPAVALASSARARMGATAEELTAAAAPVIAIVFMKLRRDMVSCAIKSHLSLFYILCRFSLAPTKQAACPPTGRKAGAVRCARHLHAFAGFPGTLTGRCLTGAILRRRPSSPFIGGL